jgi:hypothetical protein
MAPYSNELKAMVIPENFQESPMNVLKEKCLMVTHMEYECEYLRNESNTVYGSVRPVVMHFQVRVGVAHHVRLFYNWLSQNGHYNVSFLFNATFNSYQRLADYEDGMVVNGYVVSVEENYSANRGITGEEEQILLDVTLLTRSVTYVGREEQNNYKSVFIN